MDLNERIEKIGRRFMGFSLDVRRETGHGLWVAKCYSNKPQFRLARAGVSPEEAVSALELAIAEIDSVEASK